MNLLPALCCALLGLVIAMPALADEQENPEELADWTFRPVAYPPRPGMDLRVIAIDPGVPEHIYLGTQEGTVLRSFDAGLTWDETMLTPFAVQRGPEPPPPPTPEARDPTEQIVPVLQAWNALPLDYWPASRWLKPKVAIAPDPFRPGLFLFRWGTRQSEHLLAQKAHSPLVPVAAVRRILFNPGAEYPMLVVTPHELFGSDDQGVTFVRLFAMPGSGEEILAVAASPADPQEIVLGTTEGLFRSLDGGQSFVDVVFGRSQGDLSALSFVHGSAPNQYELLAGRSYLMLGSLDESAPAPKNLFPMLPAPFGDIRWVLESPSAAGTYWITTDRGVRLTTDRGKSWTSPSPALLEQNDFFYAAIGEGGQGRERVALQSDHLVYASDDGGATFKLWFSAATLREIRHVAFSRSNGVPTWWVLTKGELWMSREGEPVKALVPGLGRWAAERLGHTPTLTVCKERALERAHLTTLDLAGVDHGLVDRSYLPRVELRFDAGRTDTSLASRAFISDPQQTSSVGAQSYWLVRLTASFYLPDLFFSPQDHPQAIKQQLYIVRQQLAYTVEDVYRERSSQLALMARMGADPYEALVRSTRLEVLDAALDALTSSARTGGSLSSP